MIKTILFLVTLIVISLLYYVVENNSLNENKDTSLQKEEIKEKLPEERHEDKVVKNEVLKPLLTTTKTFKYLAKIEDRTSKAISIEERRKIEISLGLDTLKYTKVDLPKELSLSYEKYEATKNISSSREISLKDRQVLENAMGFNKLNTAKVDLPDTINFKYEKYNPTKNISVGTQEDIDRIGRELGL